MKKIPLFKVFMPDTIVEAMKETLFSGYIAEGSKTKAFREELSSYINNPNVVLMNSGTSALLIAYILAGVKAGDEVLSTPLTSIATNVPLLYLGAKPVWIDVNPETGLSDPDDLVKLINPKTKAILLLHKDGDIDNMYEIMDIAKKYNLYIIEDAAHALGAKYDDKYIGNFGDFTAFSFQAIKHITTGDGGALVVKDSNLFEQAKKLKWFGVDHDNMIGNPWLGDITEVGYKFNMNDISATIGLEAIKHLNDIVAKHNANGLLYSRLLEGVPNIRLLNRNPLSYSSYWTYVLLAERRDELAEYLRINGVGAMLVHPRNDKWSIFKNSRRALPGVDYFESHELSLPCGWWVTEDDIVYIVDLIKKFYQN
ncbi:MAG: DegT/DnrJ/EryC1/StrS family aminotransferase [Bacteroidota bacterium]